MCGGSNISLFCHTKAKWHQSSWLSWTVFIEGLLKGLGGWTSYFFTFKLQSSEFHINCPRKVKLLWAESLHEILVKTPTWWETERHTELKDPLPSFSCLWKAAACQSHTRLIMGNVAVTQVWLRPAARLSFVGLLWLFTGRGFSLRSLLLLLLTHRQWYVGLHLWDPAAEQHADADVSDGRCCGFHADAAYWTPCGEVASKPFLFSNRLHHRHADNFALTFKHNQLSTADVMSHWREFHFISKRL